MKRIVFLLNKMPHEDVIAEYRDYLNECGVEALYLECDQKFVPDYYDLVCTDDRAEYDRLKSLGENPVVSIDNVEECDRFSDAKYLLLNSQDTEVEYYEKVWQRTRDIPWTIKETNRLIIRETTVEDVDEFVELYKDPDVFKYTENLYEDIEEERKYAKEYIEKVYKVQGFGIWTLIEKESKRVIGRAGIVSREGFDGVEIGYLIGSKFQQKGYGTEAVSACVDVCRELELAPIRILTVAENEASIKVARKCGFKKAGSLDLNYVTYDEYLYFGL
ncbi:MAG: GNAT family N-acetyltransferase [Lachnospiraceae bacterium]|nr:GNAT family N-acetyltransferase [Lachnospiraceae bacterium]